jgi:hypothetical protein
MMATRNRIPLSDREIAGKLLLRLARHPVPHHDRFCLCWVYDYDCDFLMALAADLNLPKNFPTTSYLNRLRRVCRRLEVCGLLSGRVSSCHAEYLGEPRVLKSYEFGDPGYAFRLAPDLHPHYTPIGKVETELDFLLDRVYPLPSEF